MINIVIPMAGEGSRFVKAGFATPKPFLDVAGTTMIERVLANLSVPEARYILLARAEHLAAESATAERIAREWPVEFVPVADLTEGTACTVLLARTLIDDETPLLIANSDQIVDMEIGQFVDDCAQRHLDGSILCFRDQQRDPKWSYARTDDSGRVLEVREKVAISDLATVGIYLFSRGSLFVDAAIDMIVRNDRVGDEFYTCPVYNSAIALGAGIGEFTIPRDAMHGLGTPADLAAYLERIQLESR